MTRHIHNIDFLVSIPVGSKNRAATDDEVIEAVHARLTRIVKQTDYLDNLVTATVQKPDTSFCGACAEEKQREAQIRDGVIVEALCAACGDVAQCHIVKFPQGKSSYLSFRCDGCIADSLEVHPMDCDDFKVVAL